MNKLPGVFLFFVLLFTCTGRVAASKAEKAWEALQIHDYFKAKKLFYASLKKNPAVAGYGLALIYYRTDNPFHQIDSAAKYIRLAVKSFPAEVEKKEKLFSKLKLNETGILQLREEVFAFAYQQACKSNSIASMEVFLQKFPDARQFPDAIARRDSMAFRITSETDSWQAYKEFMEKYPLANQFGDAKKLYELRLFHTWTQSNSLKSFESFLEQYPQSPHRDEAENAIFSLSTLGGTIDEYYLFIRKYPSNHNVETAWYNIYTIYTNDFKPETFKDFLKVFPDYPYSENVTRDLELSRLFLLPVRQNNKWGYIDTTGKVAIPCIYEWCEPFNEGLAAVGLNGKAGFINKAGVVIFPFVYDEVENFSSGFAEVTVGDKSGVLKKTGKEILTPEFTEINVDIGVNMISLKKDGKYGFTDLNGKILIPFQFDKVSTFHQGLAAVEKEGKWGYINTSGSAVIPYRFDWAGNFSSSYAEIRENGKAGIINKTGQLVIPCRYTMVGTFSEGLIFVSDSGKYGFADSTGKLVIPMRYDYRQNKGLEEGFVNGLARACENGKIGLIDKTGKFVVPKDYQSLFIDRNSPGTFIAEKNGKSGMIDLKAKVLIPFQYSHFIPFDVNNLARVAKSEDEWGLINRQKKPVIPLEFESIDFSEECGLYLVEMDEFLGAYRKDGTLLFPPEYDDLIIQDDIILLEKDKKISYYNLKTGKFFWKEN